VHQTKFLGVKFPLVVPYQHSKCFDLWSISDFRFGIRMLNAYKVY
jgi:hypothetical protein